MSISALKTWFIVSLAFFMGIAAKRPAPSARSAGPTELEMQVLLDRANFSPGEIDGKGGKNSRKALLPGARRRCC
jgi:peptidoglycan hydrolase-like protein with peptidoglycan-binding domain